MTGSLDHQLNLLDALEIYERAEKLSAFLPDVRPLWEAADQRHGDLLRSAMACGYEPCGRDRLFGTVEWATTRAALIREHLPNNARKAA